jgi:hypothetical protein
MQLLEQLGKEFALFKKETAKIIGCLQRENASLKERLAKYENPKNSGNSSIAPSQDPFRRTKSLRGSIRQVPRRAKRAQGEQT